jgi:hypothetical protein
MRVRVVGHGSFASPFRHNNIRQRIIISSFATLSRDRIEAAASDKYDASATLRTPFIITPSDLIVHRAR